MPVFASLTGSSQKGGGYDVGSAQAVTTDPALHSPWSVPGVTSLPGSGPAQLKDSFWKICLKSTRSYYLNMTCCQSG